MAIAECIRCHRPAPPEESDEFSADWIVQELDGEVVLICTGCITDGDRRETLESGGFYGPLTADDLESRRVDPEAD